MKQFNNTGVCIPEKHYMVDVHDKLIQIVKYIEQGQYFTINRARQYGKTTTLHLLSLYLKDRFVIIKTSFEGIGDDIFSSEIHFCQRILKIFAGDMRFDYPKEAKILEMEGSQVQSMDMLSDAVSRFVSKVDKDVLLMIDEEDKSSNNQLFLSFLGMLRSKYLKMQEGRDRSFKSVILAGIHDVKNLKISMRNEDETKYNSPWNIAAQFEVEMDFQPAEIATMLKEYEEDYHTGMDIEGISQEMYTYTHGYPFLVSRLCRIIDEKVNRNWTAKGVQEAVKIILEEKNTLFDDLVKNLENNSQLYKLVQDILLEGARIQYNVDNPIIALGEMYGVLRRSEFLVMVSNQIFELRIYNYLISKRSTEKGEVIANPSSTKFEKNGKLDMELVLTKFQEVLEEEYRKKDEKFIEREGRLLFLCFLKPILNGRGFYYIEPQTRFDNRMDVVVDYAGEQHVVELKIWHGPKMEQNALLQLVGYLEGKRL